MNNKNIAKITAGVLITVGCFGGGWYWYSSSQAAKDSAKVETTKVVKVDLKSTVSATGTIKPVHSVEVSSKITARIKTVLVKENQQVKAGQTVATLDGKDYEAKAEQAQYKVVNAKAKYDRASYLYSIGANSQEQYEDAVLNYNTARSSLEVTQSDLAETIITAPMDGVIVGEPLTPGTMAVQGNNNPTVIMRIADLSSKQIKAKIDETDIGSVKIGQTAVFTVDAYNDKKFKAKVSEISQTDVTNSWDTTTSGSSSASSASVIYYYVTLDVEDPNNDLLPGMTARVEVMTSEKKDAVAVPIASLKTNANGSYVLVVKGDGSTEERPVKTGIYSDDYVEIVDGVTEGEKISNSYKAASAKNSGGQKSGMGMGMGGKRGPAGGPPRM